MPLIGFSGKKHSGKDTACSEIARHFPLTTLVPFAGPLKEFCASITGLDREFFEKEELKDQPLGSKYRDMTPRMILQEIGTNRIRTLFPEAWITAWRAIIQNTDCKTRWVLVPDVRFPNEIKAIHEAGGKVIRLTRSPYAGEDTHASEMALDAVDRTVFRNIQQVIESDPDRRAEWELLHRAFLQWGSLESFYYDALLDNSQMSIEEQNQAMWDLFKAAELIKEIPHAVVSSPSVSDTPTDESVGTPDGGEARD